MTEQLPLDQLPLASSHRKGLYGIATKISDWLSVIAAGVLALMMMIVAVDVAGRDFLNIPLRGAVEIVALLLILASTWGLATCQIQRGHIRVTLLYDLFPRKVQAILDIVAYIVCLVASGLITWQMAKLSLKYLYMAQGNVTPTLGLPFFPFMLALTWGFGWMFIILILDIVEAVREVAR